MSPGITPATIAGSALHGDTGIRGWGLQTGSVGLGGAEPALPGNPNPGQLPQRPLHNCSSQPSLISGEISGVPAQRDAEPQRQHGDKGCGSRAQCHCAGARGEGLPGPSRPFAILPSCTSPALLPPFVPLKLFLSVPPLSGSGGLCGGPLGAVERVQFPVRGGQQGPQPPGHRPAAARRGALS